MLDGLEAADRAPELLADLGVLDRHVQRARSEPPWLSAAIATHAASSSFAVLPALALAASRAVGVTATSSNLTSYAARDVDRQRRHRNARRVARHQQRQRRPSGTSPVRTATTKRCAISRVHHERLQARDPKAARFITARLQQPRRPDPGRSPLLEPRDPPLADRELRRPLLLLPTRPLRRWGLSASTDGRIGAGVSSVPAQVSRTGRVEACQAGRRCASGRDAGPALLDHLAEELGARTRIVLGDAAPWSPATPAAGTRARCQPASAGRTSIRNPSLRPLRQAEARARR